MAYCYAFFVPEQRDNTLQGCARSRNLNAERPCLQSVANCRRRARSRCSFTCFSSWRKTTPNPRYGRELQNIFSCRWKRRPRADARPSRFRPGNVPHKAPGSTCVTQRHWGSPEAARKESAVTCLTITFSNLIGDISVMKAPKRVAVTGAAGQIAQY